jgi:hypothetical protein
VGQIDLIWTPQLMNAEGPLATPNGGYARARPGSSGHARALIVEQPATQSDHLTNPPAPERRVRAAG